MNQKHKQPSQSELSEKVRAFHKRFLDLIASEKLMWVEQYPTLKELRAEFEQRSSGFSQFHATVTAAAFLELIVERLGEAAPNVRRLEEVREGDSNAPHPIQVDSYHCPHCRALIGSGWGHECLEAEDHPSWKSHFLLIVACPECNKRLTIGPDIVVRPETPLWRGMSSDLLEEEELDDDTRKD